MSYCMCSQRRIEEIERKVERVLSHKMREVLCQFNSYIVELGVGVPHAVYFSQFQEREQPQQDSGVFRKELKKVNLILL